MYLYRLYIFLAIILNETYDPFLYYVIINMDPVNKLYAFVGMIFISAEYVVYYYYYVCVCVLFL